MNKISKIISIAFAIRYSLIIIINIRSNESGLVSYQVKVTYVLNWQASLSFLCSSYNMDMPVRKLTVVNKGILSIVSNRNKYIFVSYIAKMRCETILFCDPWFDISFWETDYYSLFSLVWIKRQNCDVTRWTNDC